MLHIIPTMHLMTISELASISDAKFIHIIIIIAIGHYCEYIVREFYGDQCYDVFVILHHFN